ncbi:MAG: hypothetical protein SF053_17200 [Bacteroidia bacterium]|nr:hypothetical protein [Bacteroidia bacterium]
MHTPADKSPMSPQPTALREPPGSGIRVPAFQLTDNRASSIAQRQQQAQINRSPIVLQLKQLQDMANGQGITWSPKHPQSRTTPPALSLQADIPLTIQRKRQNATEAEYAATGIKKMGGKFTDAEGHYNTSLDKGQALKSKYEKWKAQDGKRTDPVIDALSVDYKTTIDRTGTTVDLATGIGVNAPESKDKASDHPKANYKNKYLLDQKQFRAGYNVRNKDNLQDKASNSEVIYSQYKRALRVFNNARKIKGNDLNLGADLTEKGNLRELRRHDITNVSTRDTLFWCDGWVAENQNETTVTEANDDFWALLGTENGNSAVWLIIQHGVALGMTGIREIVYGKNYFIIRYDVEPDAPAGVDEK